MVDALPREADDLDDRHALDLVAADRAGVAQLVEEAVNVCRRDLLA